MKMRMQGGQTCPRFTNTANAHSLHWQLSTETNTGICDMERYNTGQMANGHLHLPVYGMDCLAVIVSL